jgi:hypothetical protein
MSSVIDNTAEVAQPDLVNEYGKATREFFATRTQIQKSAGWKAL